jgi:hypothetical protein
VKKQLFCMAILSLVFGCGGSDTTTTPTLTPPGNDDAPKLQVTGGPSGSKAILPGSTSQPPPPNAAMERSECNAMTDGGPLTAGCITKEIKCGEILKGHTLGGVKNFDTKFYERGTCTPGLTNHDGGDERVYILNMPDGDHKAIVTLDTPCADLDLAAFKYKGDDCPDPSTTVSRCEMWPKDGNQRERVELVTQHPSTWFIIVEGKDEEEGAFALTVECREGLI